MGILSNDVSYSDSSHLAIKLRRHRPKKYFCIREMMLNKIILFKFILNNHFIKKVLYFFVNFPHDKILGA